MSKRDAARTALANVKSLHPDFHEPILHALGEQGLVEPSKLNATAAATATADSKNRIAQVCAAAEADPTKRAALRTALSSLRAAGTSLDDIIVDGNVSIAKLNDALRGQTISRRMTAKAALSAVGIID